MMRVARSNVDDRTQWTVTAHRLDTAPWWQLQRSLPVQSWLPDNVLHWAAYRKARRWPLRPDDGPIVIGLRSSTRAAQHGHGTPTGSPGIHHQITVLTRSAPSVQLSCRGDSKCGSGKCRSSRCVESWTEIVQRDSLKLLHGKCSQTSDGMKFEFYCSL